MGKTLAMVFSGLIVAGGAMFGMYSYGVFCGGDDHGCCTVIEHDCCGSSSGCCDSEKDATQTAALAIAGPAAAIQPTSQVSAMLPCCSAAASKKFSCCDDACDPTIAINAAMGVTATVK